MRSAAPSTGSAFAPRKASSLTRAAALRPGNSAEALRNAAASSGSSVTAILRSLVGTDDSVAPAVAHPSFMRDNVGYVNPKVRKLALGREHWRALKGPFRFIQDRESPDHRSSGGKSPGLLSGADQPLPSRGRRSESQRSHDRARRRICDSGARTHLPRDRLQRQPARRPCRSSPAPARHPLSCRRQLPAPPIRLLTPPADPRRTPVPSTKATLPGLGTSCGTAVDTEAAAVELSAAISSSPRCSS